MAHYPRAVAKLGSRLDHLTLHRNRYSVLPTARSSLATHPVASPPPHCQSAKLKAFALLATAGASLHGRLSETRLGSYKKLGKQAVKNKRFVETMSERAHFATKGGGLSANQEAPYPARDRSKQKPTLAVVKLGLRPGGLTWQQPSSTCTVCSHSRTRHCPPAPCLQDCLCCWDKIRLVPHSHYFSS